MKLVLQITLGILLAAAISVSANYAFLAYTIHKAADALAMTLEAQRVETEAARKAQLERQRHISLLNQQEIEKARIQRQKKALAAEKQRQYAIRKNQAWNDFFKEPEDCKVYKSDRHMVECVNMRMKAKSEFETNYSSRSRWIPIAPSNVRLPGSR